MRKVPNKNCYRVSNRKSKRVMAKCASKKNAMKQLRLLRAIQNNKNFVPRKLINRRRTQKGGFLGWMFNWGKKEEEGKNPGQQSSPTANTMGQNQAHETPHQQGMGNNAVQTTA